MQSDLDIFCDDYTIFGEKPYIKECQVAYFLVSEHNILLRSGLRGEGVHFLAVATARPCPPSHMAQSLLSKAYT